MAFMSAPLGARTLSREVLAADRKGCRKYGPCGIGTQALYMGNRYISRCYYIPWPEVRRVFKRVAMSAGGYSGHGVFGAMAFLVVQFGNGQEKDCPFKREEEVDRLLEQVKKEHPQIPVYSAEGERRLREAAAREKARYVAALTPEAEETLQELQKARDFLQEAPGIPKELASCARQKRIADRLDPKVLLAGTAVGILGLAAALYGLAGVLEGAGTGMYFLLGGGILFFFVFSANLFPGKWNSRRYAQTQWDAAVEKSRARLTGREDFPVPPQYAHPVVLDRMIRVVREGRADSAQKALEQVKEDLRALNSGVTVSQEEHDEVVEVKPLFLVCDYRS